VAAEPSSTGSPDRRRTTIVTGAAGFAGSHLLERLAGQGPLVGWCRPGGNPPQPHDAGVTWQAVDVTQRESVTRAIAAAGPERIFHLAGAASVETSWTNAVPHLRTNVLGTQHVLDAVGRVDRPCRVLVVTSAQVYGMSDDPISEDGRLLPQSPYGLTKLAQDRLALSAAAADHLDVMVARPFNHIGPRQGAGFAVSSFARQIARIERGLEPPTLRVGNLETRRDITDVRDVVDAYTRIMDGGQTGRAYNVCSGRAWRIRDLLEELLHLSAVPITVETDPERFRPVDVPVVQGDLTRIRTELGWSPHRRVEQTLKDTLDEWRRRVAEEGSR
jgi:GDP-4-dehydro-6-deoxy-D-mannose reductase